MFAYLLPSIITAIMEHNALNGKILYPHKKQRKQMSKIGFFFSKILQHIVAVSTHFLAKSLGRNN